MKKTDSSTPWANTTTAYLSCGNTKKSDVQVKVKLFFALIMVLFMLASVPGNAQISYVTGASATGATVNFSSISGWQAGDLAIVFAFRDGSTENPSLPNGFTTISAQDGTTCSAHLAWRLLLTGDGSYSFTNATETEVMILRGTTATPITKNNATSGRGVTMSYPALTGTTLSSSWIVGFGGHRSATNVNAATAGSMTIRSAATITTLGMHSITGLTSFSATNWSTVNGYSSGWITGVVEVLEAPPTLTVTPNNLSFGYAYTGSNSASQSFQLSGSNLTGFPSNITISAPSTDFQVSNDNSTWGATTTISYASSTLAATPVYVRFTPQSSGLKSGNVTFSGGGVTSPPTVALTGTGTAPATQLAFVNFPAAGYININFTSFTVEARSSDNSVDYLFNGNITLDKATGPGTLSGTTTVAAINGVATFNAVRVDQTGTYTLYANGGSLSQATSSAIEISITPTGAYRSNTPGTSGLWTTAASWQRWDGDSWETATAAPTNTAPAIEIQSGHTIYATSAPSSANLTVNGTYEHRVNGGAIPTATWDASSTCLITGITSTLTGLTGVNQTFGNFTWNCTSQSSYGGDLADGQKPVAILGNLTINATGASQYDFGLCNGDGTTSELSIGGDLIITGGVYRISYRNNVTHDVAGNIIINGGTLMMNSTEQSASYSGIGTINVDGNVLLSTGTINFSQATDRCDADDNGIINIKGNFTHSAGTTITELGNATGDVINFAGTNIQTYTSGGTVANLVNFNVNSGAILYMGTSLLGNGSAGTFTLANGGTLGIGDAAGITTSGATGNIRVTGTRIYNTGANYIYNGSAPQATGNGLPATVNSLVFNNAGGVTFTSACAVTNDFSITSSSIANLDAFSHTAGTLTLGEVVQPGCTYGSSTSTAAFKNNTFFAGTGIVTTGACASGMWLGGSADWNTTTNWFGGTVPVLATDVIITSAAPNQPVVSASPVAVCNNLTISSGSSMTINPGQALTVNGNLANSGTFTITSDAVNNNGSLIVNGSSAGTVTYNRFMPAGSAWHYVSSPVSLTSSPSGSFYGWNEVAGDWDAGTTATPASGIGYTLQTAGTAVSFTGSVVNSVSPISATSPYSDCDFPGGTVAYTTRTYAGGRDATENYGGGGWNLLGNPFTSALNVNGTGGFIAGNIGSFDPNYVAVYIYDGASYSFIGSQIPGWEETTAGFGDDNVQVGQGFFLLSHCNASTFSFTPGMQIHDISVPMTKSAKTADSPWPGLQLKVKYGEKENSTLVVYNEKMTADLDPGYDVGQLSNGPDVEIYTSLALTDNSVNFARQALPIANADTIIVPVGIDSEAGGEVTFSATTVPLANNKFWLEDRKSGTFTDLSTGTYTVTLPAKTFGTGRFFIIASTNTPTGIKQPQTDVTGVRVWTSNEKVIIQGEVSDRAICEVYNVNGKKILRTRLTGGEMNTVNLPYGSRGAFIVRVADGAKVTTRKVALL